MAASQTLEVDPSEALPGLQRGREIARTGIHLLPHTGPIVTSVVVFIAIAAFFIWVWWRNRRDGY
ncbi:MAG: hypothetical protein ABF824_13770 [Acetobacter sp.]